MQYSTKVNRTSETLQEVIDLVEKLEEDRVLYAILNKRYGHDDIMKLKLHLIEKRSRQQQEIESLRKFSQKFNKEYATNDNKCFSTANTLFNRIRSNMSGTIGILKKFCPRISGMGPIVDGIETKPSVIGNSMLSQSEPYAEYMFPQDTLDPCVREFIDELGLFLKAVNEALIMCQDVLQEEADIRGDSKRCMKLYEECCDEVWKSSHEFLAYFGEDSFVREDDMTIEMRQEPLIEDSISGHFHQHNKNEFQIHALRRGIMKGKENDLSELETFFWPRDYEKARKARIVIKYFDELNPRGRQIGDSGTYRLSAKYVAAFMIWCEIEGTMKEKNFVEKYFNTTYKGKYETVASSSVNTAKNKFIFDSQDKEVIFKGIERILNNFSQE